MAFMPIPVPRTRAVALLIFAGCALMSLTIASAASAKSVRADLRVVDSSGKTLAEMTQYTSTSATKVKTDPKADCFGDGTGGSGAKVAVPGSTALSQLAAAGRVDRDLNPLSISDSFDFGLALCGIGDAISPQTGFWYLKRNLSGSETGGDQTPVEAPDTVLWYLIEDFAAPTPDELVLNAPNRVNRDGEVRVEVTAFADDGSREPAVGATVSEAAEPTDSQGRTIASSADDLLRLRATLDGAIPSNENIICTLPAEKCPAGYAEVIAGTPKADVIEADRESETILAGGGDDKIDASAGTPHDLIKCGGGKDEVRLSGADAELAVLKGCERVRAPGKGK